VCDTWIAVCALEIVPLPALEADGAWVFVFWVVFPTPLLLEEWSAVCSLLLTSSASFAQTKVGHPAKGETSRECAEAMAEIKANAMAVAQRQHPHMKMENLERLITYSFDHAAVHEDHKLLREVAGISQKQRCPLAPWSPDFQQPIEHAHGRFKEKFRASLRDNHTKKEMNEFMKEAKRVWEEVNQAEIVNKDVERLPQLYRYVVQENTGDWAPANLS
jgi:hypothetical protein